MPDSAPAEESRAAPLRVSSSSEVAVSRPVADAWSGSLVFWFTLLGLGLRALHYLRCPDIWYDEAVLLVNVLDKSFLELLGNLPYEAPPPPLFAWLERAVYLAFGDSMYAMRLVPFLASCGAMLLVPVVARRILSAAAAPWAVLLFAVSDRMLWHACEAKQYALEVFIAIAMLWLFDALRSRPFWLQVTIFTLLAPPVIFVCYPGVFLYGGLLVGLLPQVWRSRRMSTWAGYAILTTVVVASFAVLLLGPIRAQRSEDLVNDWQELQKFPPWDHVSRVPWWMLRSTLEIFDYASRPTGFVLAPLAVLGFWSLWRRGRREWLAVMLVPMLLPLLASLVRRYPYGGVRLLAYLAPALLLLVAEGIVVLWNWFRARNVHLKRTVWVVLALLMAIPAARTLWRAAYPWVRADVGSATRYVCQHFEPGETASSWQCTYLYTFRHAPIPFQIEKECHAPPGGRVWRVITVIGDEDRAADRAKLAAGPWEILEQHDFLKVVVFRLQHR